MATIKSDSGTYTLGAKSSTQFYDKLMKEIRRLEHRLDKAEKTIKELREKNRTLKKENKALREENQRLRSQIANNSSNSSLPPSTDQKPSKEKAPNEYNSRTKSGKRPGGQPGRIGITLTRKNVKKLLKNKEVEHEVVYSGHFSIIDRYVKRKYDSYFVVDLKVVPKVVEYRLPKGTELPEKIWTKLRSGVCYGDTIRAIAVQLNTTHTVSIVHIRDFINDLTGTNLSVSTGSIYNFISDFAKQCNQGGSIDEIMDNLMHHKVLYTDATNVSVNGTQAFIRNQSNPYAVLYCPMPKKTEKMIGQSGVLSAYTGILVHDHETTLYNFGIDHAECNAHILRYLQKTIEETKSTWAKEMMKFLTKLNQYKASLMNQGATKIEPEELQKYYNEYGKIIKLGIEQNKNSKKSKYVLDKELTLLNRMKKYQYNHLLFLYDFDVPFTNNMSEQDLRKIKNKQKISGGFRKPSGQKIYCDIMSVIETMRRRDINVFNGIKGILAGKAVI